MVFLVAFEEEVVVGILLQVQLAHLIIQHLKFYKKIIMKNVIYGLVVLFYIFY